MNIRLMSSMAALAVAFAFQVQADTVWVDDDNYGKEGMTGVNAALAFGTIQEGVDAAKSGDTVLVKPGLYNQGGLNIDGLGNCRVAIDKKIFLKAESSDPADTVIMGAADEEGTKGCGPNAVRCVYVTTNLKPVIKGFTITGGYPATTATTPEAPGNAAGVNAKSANYQFYVTDCVISNNVGVRGGGVRFGTYVRCQFGVNTALSGQPLGRDISLVHCLAYRLSGGLIMGTKVYNSTIVNCTNDAVGNHDDTTLINSIVTENKIDGTLGNRFAAKNSVLRGYHETSGTYENCVIDEPYPVVAPMFDDYRTRAGSQAVGLGDAALLAEAFPDVPAEVEIFKSMDGVTVPATGAICAGCYQNPVETLGGQAFTFNTQITQSGKAGELVVGAGNGYAFYTDVNQVRVFKPIPNANYYPFRLDAGNSRIGDTDKMRYPRMDDTYLLPAPPAGTVVTNYILFANRRYYVNDAIGKDDGTYNGMSEATPFKTIQKALDQCVNNQPALICVAEGTYDEGVVTDGYTARRTRVSIKDDKMVRIKGAGRGKSFIKGAADPDSKTEDGRGPNAVACLEFGNACSCVQGFTICDGYCSTTQESKETADAADPATWLYRGGLVVNRNSDGRSQVLDCDLTNGVAYWSGMVYGGYLVRCHLYDARAFTGGLVTDSASLFDCLVDNLDTEFDTTLGQRPGLSTTCKAYRCTFYNDLPRGYLVSYPTAGRHNVFVGSAASNCKVDAGAIGNVFWNYGGAFDTNGTTEGVAYKRVDPMFADAANGDYRLANCSEAADWITYDPETFRSYVGDVNGDIPYVNANGKRVPGAFSTPVEGIRLAAAHATISHDGDTTHEGWVPLKAGESVTVTVASNKTRPFLGITLNGETLLGNPVEKTITAGSELSASGYVIETITSTNWYVNAVSGDDDNDGFTPETAWKHLTMLSENAYIAAGDRVHAAPGDYNEESVPVTFKHSFVADYDANLTRVEVPQGVTLIADEGPDVTFITGANGTEKLDTYGNGLGAVRCATLMNSAWLEGFTLRGGRTYSSSVGKNDGDQFTGGGVIATPYVSSTLCGKVYNCVFTNCAACRGGGIRGGLAINCTFDDCVATACSGVANLGWLVGCSIDNMTRGNTQWFRDSYRMSRCTVGPNVAGAVSNIMREFNALAGSGVDNTVVLCADKFTQIDTKANRFVNCYFLKMGDGVDRAGLDANCCELDTLEDFMLDADCRPMKDSPIADKAGDAVDTDTYLRNRDVTLGQRVYNETMDVGAFEHDARADYAADLGGEQARVDYADPKVVETAEGNVNIKSGALSLTLTGGDTRFSTKYGVPFEVTGDGTLTVVVNGTDTYTYTKADGAVNLEFRTKQGENTIAFAYDGDDAGVMLAKTVRKNNGTVIVVW